MRRSTPSYASWMGWDVDGVIDEERFLELLYNEPAETLIAHFERRTGEQLVRSLYTKRGREVDYSRVSCGDEYAFADTPVCAARKPFLFFLVLEPRRERPPPWGWDVNRVARLDLRTGEQTVVMDAETFATGHDGAWISRLLSAADDGSSLVCVTGTNHTISTTDEGVRVGVAYSVARLDLATGDIEPLASLRNVFF